MADEKPPTTWQQCKEIAESLNPAPADPDEAQRLATELIYGMLAASSPKGAEIAQRMRDAKGGPIEGQPGDMEAIVAMGEALKQRIAEKTGAKDVDSNTAMSVSLLREVL
ncbi:MAG TPA: hypothetical protein VLK33_20180 [Terriglobales bacterium]|nr:hypothetical protein [Terriglobales bacterium]